MGRMLKALRKLEVDSPETRSAVEECVASAPLEDAVSEAESTMASALARVERMAAEIQAEVCREEVSPVDENQTVFPQAEFHQEDAHPIEQTEEAEASFANVPDVIAAAPEVIADATDIIWPGLQDAEHAAAHGRLAENILAQIPPNGATLAFTSPVGGEGKTQVLVSLAAALAERSDDRLILVDGNLARPGVARLLKADVSLGLGQILSGVADWPRVVRRTTFRQIDVLPGLPSPELRFGAPEQLRLRSLVAQLRGVYRLVLFDVAALTRAEVVPMAACCDGVYLVVRLKHNTPAELARAAEVLKQSQNPLLGSVVVG